MFELSKTIFRMPLIVNCVSGLMCDVGMSLRNLKVVINMLKNHSTPVTLPFDFQNIFSLKFQTFQTKASIKWPEYTEAL